MSPAHRTERRARMSADSWTRAQYVAVVLVFAAALVVAISRLIALQ